MHPRTRTNVIIICGFISLFFGSDFAIPEVWKVAIGEESQEKDFPSCPDSVFSGNFVSEIL
jgi:hypothetical protein